MKTAFLFPGQGAQSAGMGQDLYNSNHIYKKTFDTCQKGAGLDLEAACFEGRRLDESEVVQPAIFAHSISLLKVLQSEGIDADICAGLSLGEYTALTAAGVFNIGECAALVRERGRLMDNAFAPGTAGMLSVIGFNLAQIEEMIGSRPNVYIANHLSEFQLVIAGYMDDLKALETVFSEAGAKMVTMIAMSGPSHAPLLDVAADTFSQVLDTTDMKPMQKNVYANVLGTPYAPGSDVRQFLAGQMRSRVRWHDCTEHMIASGIECFIEIGPSNVLTKLIKRRVGRGGAATVSVRDLPTLDKLIEQMRGGGDE